MDIKTKKQRSENMRRIGSKNTKPEIFVRSFLHSNGFRFRLHVKDLPGKPDIVLPKYKTIIEVRGCYWHRHDCERGKSFPASNTDFWQKKFFENIARDKRTKQELEALGWNVIIVWECEVKSPEILACLLKSINADERVQ